jgi:hypothetical protein
MAEVGLAAVQVLRESLLKAAEALPLRFSQLLKLLIKETTPIL